MAPDVPFEDPAAAVAVLYDALCTDSPELLTSLEEAGWDLVDLAVTAADIHPEQRPMWSVAAAGLHLVSSVSVIEQAAPGVGVIEVLEQVASAIAEANAGDPVAAQIRLVVMIAAVEHLARETLSTSSIDAVLAVRSGQELLSMDQASFVQAVQRLSTR